MIKANQKNLNRANMLIDLCTVVLSFLIAYYIRFEILKGSSSVTIEQYLVPIFVSIPVYFIFYNLFGVYTPKRTEQIDKEIAGIIKSNFIGALILVVGLYGFRIVDFSRLALIIFLIINIILTSIFKIILRNNLKRYRAKGYNQKYCVIVGVNDISHKLKNKIEKNKHWGYRILGFIDENKEGTLGGFKDLDNVLDNNSIDVVFIAIESNDYDKIAGLISSCERAGVKTNIIPSYYQYVPTKPYMDDLDGLPIIDTRHVPLDDFILWIPKRGFDILFSLFAIIITSPIMIVSVIMVKITSPGPVIYSQERVGLNRKNFDMYKFRSMKVQNKQEEKDKWTTKDDPRKTKWGSFMRKTSIDELPQFFNVLKGDMSIVGPRPERPFFVEKFRDEIPKYMVKHQVRPGITGWAQVNGYRGDTSIEGRIEHDLYYIENWTFWFDIKIIFLTVFKGLINKNAY